MSTTRITFRVSHPKDMSPEYVAKLVRRLLKKGKQACYEGPATTLNNDAACFLAWTKPRSIKRK